VSAQAETIFGRFVSAVDVEDWCWRLLQRWFGTYLAETERQAGLEAGFYQRPRGFVTAPDLEKWPEDQLPALILRSVGIPEPPLKDGGGRYRVQYGIAVSAVCSARSEQESRRMALHFLHALYALFVQRPSLDGHADGVTWLRSRVDELAYDDSRSIQHGSADFLVQVNDAVTAKSGPSTPAEPLTPDTEPWPLWPTVETTHVDVVPEELPQTATAEKGGS
jgi:hypothetical protein